MGLRLLSILLYLFALLALGAVARRRGRRTAEDFYLASRSLQGWTLFLSMAATNFSAFTVFGFSGAGWSSGYAFYPIMAFGTGFMALAFLLLGAPIWRIGKEQGLVTPPELVFHRSGGSRSLRLVFLAVMTVFTLPYLAIQPMAAGYALESLLGIPYYTGAAAVTCVVIAVVWLGGLRGEVWTDIFQGVVLIAVMALALGSVAKAYGGLSAANASAAAQWPGLFSRPGLREAFSPGVWFGYMGLWFLCDPMFPQLFQRFYAAKDPRALAATAALYPLVTGSLFLLPVSLGVLGRLTFPSLPEGATADQILPLVLHDVASPWVETLAVCAGLAALITTLDSQLLALASMAARDVWEPLRARVTRATGEASRETSAWAGRTFVVLLALAGLALAYRPLGTFVEITTETFTGLAVLFPIVWAAISWKRFSAAAAVVSIVLGEGLVVAYHFECLPTFGTLPVVPVVALTTLALYVGSRLGRPRLLPRIRLAPALGRGEKILWAVVFAGLFAASHDIWAWDDARLGWLGFPRWVWYCIGLCATLSTALWGFGRRLVGHAAPAGIGAAPTAAPQRHDRSDTRDDYDHRLRVRGKEMR
ncbi:MAG: sodium:solute symporter family protein [Candidatus Bipolaricaulota bacterium]